MAIKSYEGFEAKKLDNDRLPAGGYICAIMGTEVEHNEWGDRLVLKFDIVEGEYINYYANRYNNRVTEDEKWKGVMRVRIPDLAHQYFASERKTFNNAVFAFEASNDGYHWNWDEKPLEGKLVGILFRDAEWERDGKSGIYTEPCGLVSVEDIRTGNFKTPKLKTLKKKAEDSEPAFTPVSDVDCPF